jgi:hypothetical protein
VKNTIDRIIGLRTRLGLLTLTFLLGTVAAFGQAPAAGDSLSGKYEAIVKSDGADEKVSLDLKNEGGKMSGSLTHGGEAMKLTEGNLKDGTLTLSFGLQALLVAKVKDGNLVGNLSIGADKHAVELKKAVPPEVSAAPAAVPAAAAPAAAPAAASAPVNLSGDWEAVADANGQPFPFALTLKIDGENVTGSSSSQLGESTIKSGAWKDGKLTFQLEGQNGVVSLSATVIEGKLSGEFDFAGQMQGKWVAVKKN